MSVDFAFEQIRRSIGCDMIARKIDGLLVRSTGRGVGRLRGCVRAMRGCEPRAVRRRTIFLCILLRDIAGMATRLGGENCQVNGEGLGAISISSVVGSGPNSGVRRVTGQEFAEGGGTITNG